MRIQEAMTRNPAYITPDTPLVETARRMRDLDVGTLPVGDGVTLKGMITDRDIAIRAVAEGTDLKAARAADVMTEKVLYAFEDQSVDEAVEMMREQHVRRLIILDRDKQMVGILALADVAHGTDDSTKKAEALEGVSA